MEVIVCIERQCGHVDRARDIVARQNRITGVAGRAVRKHALVDEGRPAVGRNGPTREVASRDIIGTGVVVADDDVVAGDETRGLTLRVVVRVASRRVHENVVETDLVGKVFCARDLAGGRDDALAGLSPEDPLELRLGGR